MKTTDEKQVKAILEGVLANCLNLQTREYHTRTQDDHDGSFTGQITVGIGVDGDAWLSTDASTPMRFRNAFGGGASPRTYSALVILAKAIELDNANLPERKAPHDGND